MAVEPVEARRPLPANPLGLGDQQMAICVCSAHIAVDQFLADLYVSRGVVVINKVFGCDSIDGLVNSVSVGVVNDGDSATVRDVAPVFEIIQSAPPARAYRGSVILVPSATEA